MAVVAAPSSDSRERDVTFVLVALVGVVESFERFPGAIARDIAHQRCGADDDRAGPVLRRLLLELHEQPVKAAKPIVPIVDRSRVA